MDIKMIQLSLYVNRQIYNTGLAAYSNLLYLLSNDFFYPNLLLSQPALKVEQLPDDGLELTVFQIPEHPHFSLLLVDFGGAGGHQLTGPTALQSQLFGCGREPLPSLLQLPFQLCYPVFHLLSKKNKNKRKLFISLSPPAASSQGSRNESGTIDPHNYYFSRGSNLSVSSLSLKFTQKNFPSI